MTIDDPTDHEAKKAAAMRLAGDLRRTQPHIRASVAKAEAAIAKADASFDSRLRRQRAKAAGPEMARLITLRESGQHVAAMIYEQANGFALQTQRAKYERLQSAQPEPVETIDVLDPHHPEDDPPEAA
jgi:multidrug resistance efflux pump